MDVQPPVAATRPAIGRLAWLRTLLSAMLRWRSRRAAMGHGPHCRSLEAQPLTPAPTRTCLAQIVAREEIPYKVSGQTRQRWPGLCLALHDPISFAQPQRRARLPGSSSERLTRSSCHATPTGTRLQGTEPHHIGLSYDGKVSSQGPERSTAVTPATSLGLLCKCC